MANQIGATNKIVQIQIHASKKLRRSSAKYDLYYRSGGTWKWYRVGASLSDHQNELLSN